MLRQLPGPKTWDMAAAQIEVSLVHHCDIISWIIWNWFNYWLLMGNLSLEIEIQLSSMC